MALRSPWRWVLAAISATFLLLGISIAATGHDAGSLIAAALVTALGGWGLWTGARAGVVVTSEFIIERTFLVPGDRVRRSSVTDVVVAEDEGGMLPLPVVRPELVLVGQGRFPLTTLSRYATPRGRQRVERVVATLRHATRAV